MSDEEKHFKPEEMQDDKCHCPDPVPSDDEKMCLKCHGSDPKIIKKKRGKKNLCRPQK